jgi:hypothetical protein
MKRRGEALLIVLLCLLIPSVALAEDQKSSTETYLGELHNQGKERVIVTFTDEVDHTLVEKYGGTSIRAFKTIKGLVCEIPNENIELLKQEAAVEDVVPDMVIKLQTGYGVRDPEELTEELRLREEYFARIEEEYSAAVEEARRELIKFYQDELAAKREIIERYARFLQYLRDNGYEDTWIYKWILSRYNELLEEYYAARRAGIQKYHEKIALAKNVYVQLASIWREKVQETMALAYTGPAEVRWNNLEAGLNAKAAWDNYNLDGTGVKIAFLDTGINYTMENLDDNYLGGYDFVNDDDDPMPAIDGTEDHGTNIVSLAVGEGVNKVVGTAYNASYYAVRVMGSDDGGFISDMIFGVEWASQEPHKADIISMSFGTYGGYLWEQYYKPWFEEACNNAYNNGIILVASSGNDGHNYSAWPAAFDNVISVGGHAEDQTLYDHEGDSSNGGVEIIAPGEQVYTVGADNSAWLCSGTSLATPHASALIALQLQYARQRRIEVNNAYLWEVMKEAAIDLGLDPVYQGKGKIWAAETDPPPASPHNGSIDLMGSSIWPFEFIFTYYNYLYLLDGLYPAYFLGTMSQDIDIENISDRPDIPDTYVENLNVTTIQKYRDTLAILPGDSTEDFETYEPITLNPGDIVTLVDDYALPISANPGLYNVVLDLEFNLVGNPRLIKITMDEASIWCPPGPPPDNTGYGIIETGYGLE